MTVTKDIDLLEEHFTRIYLEPLPTMITDGASYLAFVCMFVGIDVLGGYFRPSGDRRFIDFMSEFFPENYRPELPDLWRMRTSLIHAFGPEPYNLTAHDSAMHLLEAPKTLNAESFYADFRSASMEYLKGLRSDPELRARFATRIAQRGGGMPDTIASVAGAEDLAVAAMTPSDTTRMTTTRRVPPKD